MCGRVAKRIRREIYKDQSLKIIRRYHKLQNGQIVNIGRRQEYQDAKRDYIERRDDK